VRRQNACQFSLLFIPAEDAGMRIVRAFSQQLNGEIAVKSGG
jgi:hypothetical protein